MTRPEGFALMGKPHTLDEWWEFQQEQEFPAFQRGDIFFSRSFGFIGGLIALFQMHGGVWSHTGVYVGLGKVAEANPPHGGVNSFRRYWTPKHQVIVLRCLHWTVDDRAQIVSEAVRLAPRGYDKLNIVRHLVDNVIFRIFGKRPMARWIPDRDKDWKNVCSELVGRAIHWGTAHPLLEDVQVGQETPEDVYKGLLDLDSVVVFHQDRGKLLAKGSTR